MPFPSPDGLLLAMGALATSAWLGAEEAPVGVFSHHGDVGAPALAGATTYDPEAQAYHLSAAGTNLWGGRDEFQFAWRRLEGNFILRARVAFVGAGVDPHRKLGWMVRAELDAGSTYADACLHGDGLTSLQYRATKDGETAQIELENRRDGSLPEVLQFERRGRKFIFSAARFGEPLRAVEWAESDLPDAVHVGLFLCSHDAAVVERAVFREVRIIRPAAPDFRPYQDYLGATLEILDVASGASRVRLTSEEPFEAPNWTRDGERLIVNVSGSGPARGTLRAVEVATGRSERLATGAVVRNNNDHVLSFDGARLGLSSHVGPAGISTLFVMPATGSDAPEQVTEPAWGHSFLHGWSPDGGALVYTAQRGGHYNIHRIDLATRRETRLTELATLDDGPEFSPDGRWIYFNSARTGRMQIWRMRPDGAGQEQVFSDGWQNWFPHVSPDGRWLTVLSYAADEVGAEEHPYYRHVLVRLVPTDGSAAPRVIAYVYGGQGTINVPSWSPDGRRIAFVSNGVVR